MASAHPLRRARPVTQAPSSRAQWYPVDVSNSNLGIAIEKCKCLIQIFIGRAPSRTIKCYASKHPTNAPRLLGIVGSLANQMPTRKQGQPNKNSEAAWRRPWHILECVRMGASCCLTWHFSGCAFSGRKTTSQNLPCQTWLNVFSLKSCPFGLTPPGSCFHQHFTKSMSSQLRLSFHQGWLLCARQIQWI